jgi:hypothetical protein
LKIRKVKFRNEAGEFVLVETESEKMSQTVDHHRNLAGEVVVRQIKTVETVK